jgi:hemolysin type calcium-binding protein
MANIKGTSGADNLIGGANDDHLRGTDGDDALNGGGGNDQIDGGKGIDVANYSGNFGDYTISYQDNGNDHIGVTDNVAARDGSDTLKNVEFLKFADATFDVGLSVTHFADKTIDSLAVQSANPTDPNFGPHPGTMWFGTGNLPTHYNIADLNAQDVELGLKIHSRQGSDYLPTQVDNDGTAHYTVSAGAQPGNPARAEWNVDYVVDTGINGSSGKLSDFDFEAVIKQTLPSNATHTETFILDPTTHIWSNASHTSGFAGDDNVPAAIANQVAENSVNLGFATLQAVFGPLATSTAAGTQYDIQLEAFDTGHGHHAQQLIGSVHDVITLA